MTQHDHNFDLSDSGVVTFNGMEAEVILASISENAKPLVTFRLRYPRIIHAEIMTHRVFSRNARSSRAVPVSKMVDEVSTAPFVPWHWGKNQRGMQASEECDVAVTLNDFIWRNEAWEETTSDHTREEAWYLAANKAVEFAQAFTDAGYHKQVVNRLLEPFMWIDVLVTACEWDNFFWLRDHEAAEPHLRDLARIMKEAMDQASFEALAPGHWHLPYIEQKDLDAHDLETCKKLSAVRCARISYASFNGQDSLEAEMKRFDLLTNDDRLHASPFEHQATPDAMRLYRREELRDGQWVRCGEYFDYCNPELHGNLPGWIQNRKMMPGENHVA